MSDITVEVLFGFQWLLSTSYTDLLIGIIRANCHTFSGCVGLLNDVIKPILKPSWKSCDTKKHNVYGILILAVCLSNLRVTMFRTELLVQEI